MDTDRISATFTRTIRHGLTALLLAVSATTIGCGGSDDAAPPATTGTTAATTTTATTAAPTTSAPSPTTTQPATDVHQVRVYLLRDEVLAPVARTVEGAGVGLSATRELLLGPTATERARGLSSAVPDGTQVRRLTIEGSTAVVDLSPEFSSGGGTASMMGRVAQVVFTLTQFPNVDAVEFLIDGQPLEALSGEGLEIDGPQRRDDWEALSPAILIESPLPDAEITLPLRVVGTANTFEAMFRISIVDSTGAVVVDEPVRATSGTGTRGTFDVTIRSETATPGNGELIAYELSAKDGERINVVTVPIVLA